MEKRTTLALILSFVILVIWSWLFPPPKANPTKRTQTIESKEFVENLQSLEKPVFEPNSPAPALEAAEGVYELLETDKIALSISNQGAAISNAKIKQFDHAMPINFLMTLDSFEKASFVVTQKTSNFLEYQYNSKDFSITKSYKALNDGYSFIHAVQITNNGEMSKKTDLKTNVFSVDGSRMDNTSKLTSTLWEYSFFSNNFVYRKRSHPKFTHKFLLNETKDIGWIGFRDQYYCAIFKPLYDATAFGVNPANEQLLNVSMAKEEVGIAPGQTLSLQTMLYFGPQNSSILKSYKEKFEDIIDFRIGNFFDVMAFGLTDVIAKIMLAYLNLIHKLLPNWGLCIVIFALTIFGVTYPLTRASMVAMKKMQIIQPKIAKLREQYKNNPQKMNEELVGLYKKHKANPFGGCLPIFFQMPIFVSLYQLLWRSYIFKGADFLWINDLSEPDRLFKMPFSLPFLGEYFNLLPILYAVLMFVQQKITAKAAIYTDPQQAEMQKMMTTIMPFMLGFLFYNFASGLCLYFTVYFALSTLAQWKLKIPNQDPENA